MFDEEFKRELNDLKDNWTFEKAVEIDNQIAAILSESPVGKEVEYLEKFMKLTAMAAMSHSIMIERWKSMSELTKVIDQD